MADIAFNRIKVLIKEYASGNVVEDVSNDLVQANWTYKRHGGLESFCIVLARDSAGVLSANMPIVEIWLQDSDTSWTCVAAGQCAREYPMYAAGRVPLVSLDCIGYLQQLQTAYFTHTYENDDVDTIVEDIIDTQIASDVDITRWTAKTTAGSGTAITRFEFTGTAYDAICQIAELMGNVAWGVMPAYISGTQYYAKFYFVAEVATVNNRYFADEMYDIDFAIDFNRIRNNLVMRGDVQLDDGDPIDTTEEDSTSQTTYGKRTEIIDNAYVDNATDAATYLGNIETSLKDPGYGLGFTVKNKSVQHRYERNIPWGVTHVWDVFSTVNTREWYANSVTYVATADAQIDMYINLGDKLGPRRIFPPQQNAQAPGSSGERNWMPNYGRGGYNPLNPNYNEIDWGRPVNTPRGIRYGTKDYWKNIDSLKKRK